MFTRDKTPEQKAQEVSRFKINEAMEKYKPSSKSRLLAERAGELDARMHTVKMNKLEKLSLKHAERAAKYRQRQHTRDLRVMKQDRVAVLRSWTRVFIVLGICTSASHIIPSRRALHAKSRKLVGVLCVIARVLGKFMQPMRKVRRSKALGKLNALNSYSKKWIRTLRRRQCKYIAECLEQGITQGILVQLMAHWKGKLVQIQRSMKWLLMWKRIRYRWFVKLWTAFELRTRKLQTPVEVKLVLLRQLVKRRLHKYISEVKEWREDCEAERKVHEENYYLVKTDHVLSGSRRLLKLILPTKPTFTPVLTNHDIELLHETAERSRLRWDGLISRANVYVVTSRA